jgi:hypothetical protein
MSVNKYKLHVLVLPEDRANSQIANGFSTDVYLSTWRIQVLEEAGGWMDVLSHFRLDHIVGMDRFPQRMMVLLIDFDGRQDRLNFAKHEIPERLSDRVFILGVFTEPEDLKVKLGSYEEIGLALAKDCREETDMTWGHELLRHNAGELERLREHVRPILFSGSL